MTGHGYLRVRRNATYGPVPVAGKSLSARRWGGTCTVATLVWGPVATRWRLKLQGIFKKIT